jgi:hypothetical protein
MLLSEYRKDRNALSRKALLLTGDPLGERWSLTRAAQALNDVVLDFCLKTQMIKEEINVQLKQNVHEYDIKTLIEEDGTLRFYGYPIRLGFNGNNNPGMWPMTLLAIDLLGIPQTSGTNTHQWHLDSVSPGKVLLFGPPAQDGEALPSEENNMQVTYIALPTYMSAGGSFPDTKIPVISYEAFPYGAASRLLDEGDEQDLLKSLEMDFMYRKWTLEAIADEYRNLTPYDDVRPG